MTRQIRVGNVLVGGGAPVSIQSMLNTKTTDVEGSLRQLKALQAAGCQIARLAVPNEAAARSFREIAAQSPLPLVADIHFDYKLAIAAAEGGAAKIRIMQEKSAQLLQTSLDNHPYEVQYDAIVLGTVATSTATD